MALKGNVQVENLEAVEDPQLDLGAQVPAAPRAKRQARQAEDAQGEDPYLEAINELDDVLLKFKKYVKSMSSIENKVFGGLSSCFKSKNERVDAYSFACSSYTDKIEEYLYDPANSFPYKRGGKLVPKENSIYVEVGADTDMYGICVDVCEFSCTAYVLPITNNFEGYLVTRNPSIKIGEILDINNNGVIIKAGGGPPTVINIYALSDSFTINFAPEDGNQDQNRYPRQEYSINLIKVAIFGNRGLEKIVIPDGG